MQAALRGVFAAWGRPVRLRVDNGAPWGGHSDLPPDLALWLIGLGVAVHWNRPRRCQENAHVERSPGVLAAWAEPARQPDAAALGRALAEAARRQRERYPACGGRPRLAAHPALARGGRPYEAAAEAALFDERRVWADLGRRTARRVVDRVGRISLYNRPRGVGRRWAGAEVTVRLDPERVEWVVRDARGAELRRHPAPELGRERLLALEVTRRRARPPRRGKACAAHGA